MDVSFKAISRAIPPLASTNIDTGRAKYPFMTYRHVVSRETLDIFPIARGTLSIVTIVF